MMLRIFIGRGVSAKAVFDYWKKRVDAEAAEGADVCPPTLAWPEIEYGLDNSWGNPRPRTLEATVAFINGFYLGHIYGKAEPVVGILTMSEEVAQYYRDGNLPHMAKVEIHEVGSDG